MPEKERDYLPALSWAGVGKCQVPLCMNSKEKDDIIRCPLTAKGKDEKQEKRRLIGVKQGRQQLYKKPLQIV